MILQKVSLPSCKPVIMSSQFEISGVQCVPHKKPPLCCLPHTFFVYSHLSRLVAFSALSHHYLLALCILLACIGLIPFFFYLLTSYICQQNQEPSYFPLHSHSKMCFLNCYTVFVLLYVYMFLILTGIRKRLCTHFLIPPGHLTECFLYRVQQIPIGWMNSKSLEHVCFSYFNEVLWQIIFSF